MSNKNCRERIVFSPSDFRPLDATAEHPRCFWIVFCTSSVALLQPELCAQIDSTSQDDLNNTNSLANLARVADRVQTSQCDRRTRLMSLNRFL
eukprot:6102636-Pyramimonas_sp.AAC.1